MKRCNVCLEFSNYTFDEPLIRVIPKGMTFFVYPRIYIFINLFINYNYILINYN